MPQVRVPANVSSITLVTSGVLVPVGGLITCTVAEANDLCSPYSRAPNSCSIIDSIAPPTNTCRMQFPQSVTSITIGGNVIAVAAGISGAIPAAAAAAMLLACEQVLTIFQLVTG